jgi:glycosyltransferase involved in cell wall biosynthesis
MRVLIATENAGIVGGIETYLRALLPLLRAVGYDIGLLVGTGSVTRDGILAGCPDVPAWSAAQRPAAAILGDIDRWAPDLVFGHGIADPTLEAALVKRFPSVFFAHVYHGTCLSGTKCHSWPAYQSCSRTFGLGCLCAYLPRRCGGWNPFRMVDLYRIQQGRRASLDHYAAVVVASRYMAEEFRRNGVEENRLHVIPHFPTDVAPDPDPPPPRPRSDRVLFVGRITRLKGLVHLIEALPRATAELGRRLTLVVAGDGPERGAAEAAARKRTVQAEFLGWVDSERRQAEMRAADVLAVPSVWPEPFGLVGVEAGCVGLPAVGYATGGIPDWLIPGTSGESAPGHCPDPAALAAALVRALADDSHLQRLRVGAWIGARRFTPESHLDRLRPILSAAAGRPDLQAT